MILDCLTVVDQTDPFPSQRQSINHPPVISTLSSDSVKGVNEALGKQSHGLLFLQQP